MGAVPHAVEAGLRAIHFALRWLAHRALALAASGAVFVGSAAAEPPARLPGSVVVDVRAVDGAPAWLAAALNEHLSRELATYDRLRVHRRDRSVTDDCGPDPGCRVQRYQWAGVDVVFVADADATALRYALYETWTPSKVAEGDIALQATGGLLGLRQRLLKAFAPVLTPGGLLDQKPYRAEVGPLADVPASAAASPKTARNRDLAALLAAMAAFFLLPLVVARRLAAKTRPLRAARWPSMWLAAFALTGAIALIAAAESALIPPTVTLHLGALDNRRWVVGLFGGAAWGAFLISNVGLLFPALPGLDRVAHRDVFRLIRAWSFVCVTRLATLTAYYLPFAVALSAANVALGLPSTIWSVAVVPAAGLVARLWLSSWMRGLARSFLDRAPRPSVRAASLDNPVASGRSRATSRDTSVEPGWALEPEFLDSIIFVPAGPPRRHPVLWRRLDATARVVVNEHLP